MDASQQESLHYKREARTIVYTVEESYFGIQFWGYFDEVLQAKQQSIKYIGSTTEEQV